MSTGSRIKQLREEKNLTQEELAKRLSISKSAVSMYENDTRLPKRDIMESLADFFNVSIDYLYGKTNLTTLLLTSKERIVVEAYRRADQPIKQAVDKLLDIQPQEVSLSNFQKNA